MLKEVRFVDLNMQQREQLFEQIEQLTPRELDVLEDLDGRTYCEVALELSIGQQTVKTHLKSITKKLTIIDQHGYELKLNGKDQLALAWMAYLRKKEASVSTHESGEPQPLQTVISSPIPAEEYRKDRASQSKWIILGIIAIVLVLLSVVGFVVYPQVNPCFRFRDLTRYHWDAVSATWESKGVWGNKQIVITENDPEARYGKVESETFTFDVTHCPRFQMHINMIDDSTALTVQILDKNTGEARDIIENANHNGTWSADLTQHEGWGNPGMQSFTLNIWISGSSDNQSATLDMISFSR